MLLPVNILADLAGAAVVTERGNAGVTVRKGALTVTLVPNRPQALVNDRAILLPAPVVMHNGRLYAPAGEVGRAIGLRIGWDARARALAVAPAIGKIERFTTGLKLCWIAGDFDGDHNEELAYAVTGVYGTPTTRLWIARGVTPAWQRFVAGAGAQRLVVRDVTGDGKDDLLVFAMVMKNNKPVLMKFTYTWRANAMKGVSAEAVVGGA
ncbi:MAG: hypothetical protein BWY76_03527 [bacterium ADurb.Bin429]|nr:MAG: hypothetical protein BWY76_03527 [bacterium ADurb.Bin429]